MAPKTYDSKKVIITFGVDVLSGYADGDFVAVTPSAEAFTKQVGADGEVMRSKSNDYTHEVVVTLLQSSLSNDVLSLALTQDKLLNSGAKPLQIVDLSGTSLHFWPVAWIRQSADVANGKEGGERAWTFDTGQIAQENIGGNLPAIPSV